MKSSPFLGIKKLSGSGHLLRAARHNRRAIQAELCIHGHIDAKRSHLNRTLLGRPTPEDVAAHAIEQRLAAGITKLRKDAVTAVEIVFSLPAGSPIDHDEYFSRCLAWAGGQFGGAGNILSADIHNDEAHPHLHVLMLPLRDGRMVGSDMVGNRQALASKQTNFHKEVASHFGLSKRPARLAGAAKADAIARVVATLNARNDPALRSTLWPVIRASIDNDPASWLEQLGIQVAERTKRLKSFADIFTGPGKGPKREANPVGFGFAPSRKDRSLSCVGFAPDDAEVSDPAHALADQLSAGADSSSESSHPGKLAEATLQNAITALAHLEAMQAQTASEDSILTGDGAGCGLPCGSIHEPLQTGTGTSETASELRNPKVALVCVNSIERPAQRIESSERASQVAYRLPTSSPETTKPRRASEAKSLILLVPEKGIEPSTFSLRMSCSTD